MERNKMIIVEGPQGTGKTTLTNYLRDNIPCSNLLRLAGQKDKTETGLNYSKKMYDALIEYLVKMQDIPMNMIFDRTFMTEEVYARLGYKDYSFSEEYRNLLEKFNNLKYDIYYFSLYLENPELFRQRLARDSHHNYQAFSTESSTNQQEKYLEISEELKEYDNFNVIRMPMDDFEQSYKEIKKILKINNS